MQGAPCAPFLQLPPTDHRFLRQQTPKHGKIRQPQSRTHGGINPGPNRIHIHFREGFQPLFPQPIIRRRQYFQLLSRKAVYIRDREIS
jgi:hypothetical protein